MGSGQHARYRGHRPALFARVRIKVGKAQKGIERALNVAAERVGLPRRGDRGDVRAGLRLQEVGVRREQVGEFGVELVVTGTSSTEMRWIRPDGKRQKSVPKAVKEHHAEELKSSRGLPGTYRRCCRLSGTGSRTCISSKRAGRFPIWRERYLDHPLVGTLARRLVWRFSSEDRVAAVSSTTAGSGSRR